MLMLMLMHRMSAEPMETAADCHPRARECLALNTLAVGLEALLVRIEKTGDGWTR